ncbi:MAG: acyl-CoA dehydrogenase family protein [Dehalococcoidia bacterium]|nr:acyl-CoA dehydrogenase family protein [Dehalococcoidia bacterium]
MATVTTTPRAKELVAPVAGITRQYADQMEHERRMPEELFSALANAGLFRIYVPPELGEGGLPVPEALRVVEALAEVDGSAGWTVAVGFTTGLLTGGLDETVARRVVESPRVLIAGRGGQPGRAVRVDGGYRISGQWNFVSGMVNANWLSCDAIIFDGDQPRMQENGMPEDILFFTPRETGELVDTWHVCGLKGSGSYDMRLTDVFVPDELTMPGLLSLKPRWKRTGPRQRIPLLATIAMSQAPPVCLGIARHAIDAFVGLAETKTHTASLRPLKERPAAEMAVGRAEALVQSARLFFHNTVQHTWDTVSAGKDLSPREHTMLRLACVNAAESSASAVDGLWRMAGATAIFESCELDRCWRDVHAAAQHVQVQEANWESAGRVLMGMDPGTFLF